MMSEKFKVKIKRLEEMPAASAGLPNYSTIASEPSAVPEPSTLLLVGLGVLGLVVLRKRWSQQ